MSSLRRQLMHITVDVSQDKVRRRFAHPGQCSISMGLDGNPQDGLIAIIGGDANLRLHGLSIIGDH